MVIDEIEELKKEYAEGIAERITSIHQATDQIIQALTHRRKPNWEALETSVHKLAGSSGTYGFTALSHLARYMEDLITEKRIQGVAPQLALAHISRWFDALERESHAVRARTTKNSGKALSELKDHWASLTTTTSRKAA